MSVHPASATSAAISRINSSVFSQSQARGPSEASGQVAAQSKSDAAAINASSSAAAALKEATETSVQTAQEAGKGDRQAQRLLQKEAAAKQPSQPTVNTFGQVIGKVVNTKV